MSSNQSKTFQRLAREARSGQSLAAKAKVQAVQSQRPVGTNLILRSSEEVEESQYEQSQEREAMIQDKHGLVAAKVGPDEPHLLLEEGTQVEWNLESARMTPKSHSPVPTETGRNKTCRTRV